MGHIRGPWAQGPRARGQGHPGGRAPPFQGKPSGNIAPETKNILGSGKCVCGKYVKKMDPYKWALGPNRPWAQWALGPNGPWGPWAQTGPGPSGPWAQMVAGPKWALGPNGPWDQMGRAGPGTNEWQKMRQRVTVSGTCANTG